MFDLTSGLVETNKDKNLSIDVQYRNELEQLYKVPVICCDVNNLNKGDIDNIMSNILTQFPQYTPMQKKTRPT